MLRLSRRRPQVLILRCPDCAAPLGWSAFYSFGLFVADLLLPSARIPSLDEVQSPSGGRTISRSLMIARGRGY
ncbi:hypothetical protein EMPG_11329 [Blastomyces silverae]|uniref:Uncharacterized protein n=1 Tax=Blastomyces silverae TaxID=2060906 RepID=A0A0H1BQB6_9EURO|nr:hypothetical protein EMPG_11329 [Blastomyces silverae]